MCDIEKVVHDSTTGEQNIALSTVDICSGKRNVQWYNWSDYLNNSFRSIPAITKYHHFRVDKSAPGIVMMREYVNAEETQYTIVKNEKTVDDLPSVVIPTGMSIERQLYLYEKIRRYCTSEEDATFTCPFPTIVGSAQSQVSTKIKSPKMSKGSRLCSYCCKPGHTKTVKGKITCPELMK